MHGQVRSVLSCGASVASCSDSAPRKCSAAGECEEDRSAMHNIDPS